MSTLSKHAKPPPPDMTSRVALRRSSTRTAIAWLPKRDTARQEWLVAGRRLGGISRCNQWWLGDWIGYGAQKWGEKYTQAAKVTGYDARSLANMASIARVFEPSRRRENLTWSHHAAVSALPEHEREAWLDRAVNERLSVADLRTELRASRKSRGLDAASEGARRASISDFVIVCPRCGENLSEEELDLARSNAVLQGRRRELA